MGAKRSRGTGDLSPLLYEGLVLGRPSDTVRRFHWTIRCLLPSERADRSRLSYCASEAMASGDPHVSPTYW